MENKKNLCINCAICDVRNVSEELLNTYGEVRINAASLVTNQAAQALLGRFAVRINCAQTVSLAENIHFSVINGPLTITAKQPATEEKLYMAVNGPVFIEPGSEETLKNYAGMSVNGPVTCPDSVTGLLAAFCINGPISTYPDGAIILKKTVVLDRLFHLRAKQDALYYAASKVIALSPDAAFDKLAEKNVRFVTRTLLVSESLAEAAVPLFDEKADIIILPDGCACVDGDVRLDETLVRRHGGKLYISGDLTIGPDSAAALGQVSFLRVRGGLYVCRSLKDQVLALDAEYEDLYAVGGVLVSDRASTEISAAMLENAEDGLSVANCASVSIAEDITPELLREKLVSISSCASVLCTEEQRPVIEELAREVAAIVCGGEEDEEDDESGQDSEDVYTVRINAASYTL